MWDYPVVRLNNPHPSKWTSPLSLPHVGCTIGCPSLIEILNLSTYLSCLPLLATPVTRLVQKFIFFLGRHPSYSTPYLCY